MSAGGRSPAPPRARLTDDRHPASPDGISRDYSDEIDSSMGQGAGTAGAVPHQAVAPGRELAARRQRSYEPTSLVEDPDRDGLGAGKIEADRGLGVRGI